jgi:hypothetical protein
MKFEKVFKLFVKELRNDPELFYAYQANIAMEFQDEAYRQKSRDSRSKLHSISNQAAKSFLNRLIHYE